MLFGFLDFSIYLSILSCIEPASEDPFAINHIPSIAIETLYELFDEKKRGLSSTSVEVEDLP